MAKILLLHGALGTKDQLSGIKARLSEHFEVYDLNFEGHGDAASNKDFSIDLFTENVIGFLEQNSLNDMIIFGYSMGGYVALNLALKKPDLVSKIVTYGTKFDWTADTAEREVKMLNPEKIEEKVPAFAERLNAVHISNNWKDVMNKTAQMMLDLGNGKKLTPEDLRKIQTETLVTIGSKDHMVSVEESTMTANSLAKGELMIFENEQHLIEKVNAKVLCDSLVEFVNPSS